MSILVIDRTFGEHARALEEFLHDFQVKNRQEPKVVDPDSREGTEICQLYDVVEYPSVLALSQDGQLRQFWRGLPFPLVSEVSYYVE